MSEMESGTEVGKAAGHMDPKRKLPSFHLNVSSSIAVEVLEADHEAWVQATGDCGPSDNLRLSVLTCIMGTVTAPCHTKVIMRWKWHATQKVLDKQ